MMTEKESFIQLKKDNILRIGIRDAQGNDTGHHLEFDMEDIEFPLRLNQAEAQHRRNVEDLKAQFIIIDKKEDKKGKYLLTWKQEEKLKALKEFYEKDIKALELFLGEGMVGKLLNGRKPYYEMYDDISEMLEPIMPMLKANTDSIVGKIKGKYGNKKENDVLE